MKWTTEKPTREGWYWYRPFPDIDPSMAHIVDAYSDGLFVHGQSVAGYLKDLEGQWSDAPIPQPE